MRQVEFGAKLDVALCDGSAWVDHIGWKPATKANG